MNARPFLHYPTITAARHAEPEIRKLHAIWAAMLARCTRATSKSYKRYGARGITVCEAWYSFHRFYDDMAPKPDGLTLERIDNDGNYEPGNCRWASRSDQSNNRASNTRISHEGRTLTLTQWGREIGVSADCIRARLQNGLPIADALSRAKYVRLSKEKRCR